MNARKAFEEAYLVHKDRLLTLAMGLTGERSLAEDVVHDVFASLIEEPGRLRDGKNILGFLAVCTRNRAYDLSRKRKRMEGHATGISASLRNGVDNDPVEQAALGEEQQALLGAVSRLSGDLREVVSLRVWGELTFEEIAGLQGTSKSTAHARYRGGLQKLRIEFAKGG